MKNNTGNSPQWDAATEAIRTAQKILVVSHVSPDGDAIGSSLGLANALQQMGKDVTVANDDGVPPFLRWLPGAEDIVTEVTSGEFDLMISTDSSDEIRTGKVGAYGRAHSAKVINLDHHPTNTFFGDIYLVVPTTVSATEIVFDWWQHAGIEIHREIAIPLLTGLVTDTNGFRVSAVTARTLQIAQALMQYGASLTEVTARTLHTMTYDEFILWKQILPTA
ncbi:MAG: DHH family phosphoesterase, partial [Anaerolineae bacterium]|nr:DHH family phosphoesterase [Anaerolineae bacterium]